MNSNSESPFMLRGSGITKTMKSNLISELDKIDELLKPDGPFVEENSSTEKKWQAYVKWKKFS